MNLSKIKAIMEAILQADVVRIIQGPNKYTIVDRFQFDDPSGDRPNNEVLSFAWDGVGGEEKGLKFQVCFTESNIDLCTLKAEEGIVKLCDSEGNLVELQLCSVVPKPFVAVF